MSAYTEITDKKVSPHHFMRGFLRYASHFFAFVMGETII